VARVAKRVACLTMTRDEDVFLAVWHRYYAGLFGPENLFIVDHNSSASPPAQVLGAGDRNVFRLPFDSPSHMTEGDRFAFDRERFLFVSDLVGALLKYYDTVIFNDTDEVFVADPEVYPDLAAYLAANDDEVIAGIGLEILHDPAEEPPFDPASPVLAQRRCFVYRFHHSKPHILSRPCRIGGHGSRRPFRLDPDLYLMHLKFVDWDRSLERQRKLLGFFQDGRGGERSRWRLDAAEVERRMAEKLAMPRREGFEHHALLARWLGQDGRAVVRTPPKRRRSDLIQLTDVLPAAGVRRAQAVRRVLPARFRDVRV
jgi:hypothetical protein